MVIEDDDLSRFFYSIFVNRWLSWIFNTKIVHWSEKEHPGNREKRQGPEETPREHITDRRRNIQGTEKNARDHITVRRRNTQGTYHWSEKKHPGIGEETLGNLWTENVWMIRGTEFGGMLIWKNISPCNFLLLINIKGTSSDLILFQCPCLSEHKHKSNQRRRGRDVSTYIREKWTFGRKIFVLGGYLSTHRDLIDACR